MPWYCLDQDVLIEAARRGIKFPDLVVIGQCIFEHNTEPDRRPRLGYNYIDSINVFCDQRPVDKPELGIAWIEYEGPPDRSKNVDYYRTP